MPDKRQFFSQYILYIYRENGEKIMKALLIRFINRNKKFSPADLI